MTPPRTSLGSPGAARVLEAAAVAASERARSSAGDDLRAMCCETSAATNHAVLAKLREMGVK